MLKQAGIVGSAAYVSKDLRAPWRLGKRSKPNRGRIAWALAFFQRGKIPYAAIQQHAIQNGEKRTGPGHGGCLVPLLSSESEEVIVGVLVWKGRANEGAGVKGAVGILEEIHPNLTRQKISWAFRRTVRPALSYRLTNPRRCPNHGGQADCH